ncbi:Gp30 [Klebsiella phage phiKO2]|uniref:transcriptional repressor n=1 Tax=Klebsiella oxytoca phage phiKO2 TaxID=255431 RepID=UPI0000242EC5|nr:transcriptional repressor [Klebsiella phage phiKO2]AAR83046.1 Gp30 [Klebsiella phage phiKO2]
MVAQAGQLSGWPVADWAGIPTLVWVTTNECRNSGGDLNHQLEGLPYVHIQICRDLPYR